MDVHIEHVQLESIKGIKNNICSLKVAVNSFVFTLRNGNVYYIDLDKPSTINNVKIPLVENTETSKERIITTWLNIKGTKLFVKTNFANYYLIDLKEATIQKEMNKQKCIYIVKNLPKRDCDIKYVQWLDGNKLICGTANGKILSIDFTNRSKNPAVHTCWTSNKNKPILGLLYCEKSGNLLVALRNRLLLWRQDYPDIPESVVDLLKREPKENEDFKFLNQTSKTASTSEFRTTFSSLNNSIFAWTTSSAVVYGDISSNNSSNEKILNNAKILFNNEMNSSTSNLDDLPVKDIVLTDYHMIILRGSTLTMVNQLDNKIAFQENIKSSSDMTGSNREQFLGLTVDNYNTSEGLTFWCFSSNNVYEIIINNESQAVWDLLCTQKSFDKALSLQGLDDWIKSLIYYRKGVNLFEEQNDISTAAKCFAESDSSTIGEVALRFMDYNKDPAKDANESLAALQKYLIIKMEQLNKSKDEADNKVTTTLLSSWIIWNFMRQANDIDEQISLNAGVNEKALTTKKNTIQMTFNKFLKDNLDFLDVPTVYQIITNQNRTYDLLFFANLINDYEYMISYWIKQENWYESLKILLKYQNPSTVYKYSTILLVSSPDATINTWMKIRNLNVVNLLPAILTFFTNFKKNNSTVSHERSKVVKNYALIYLLNYIEENSMSSGKIPPILFNTSIYMMLSSKECYNTTSFGIEESKIITFLKDYEGSYDINFILQLSMKFRCHRVAMYLLSDLKLYEEAVSIGLKNDIVDEAKEIANKIDVTQETELDQEKLKKRLWLKIADHTLSNTSPDSLDIKQIINSLLLESNNVLEIKDLLILCNKATTIANLKDELIKSLEKHNERMNVISKDIKRSILLKDRIKNEIKNFDKKYNVIESGNSCNYCDEFLQSRKFIIFPCNHCYHKDCIMKLILNSSDYNLISEIQKLTKNVKNGHLDKTTEIELEKVLSTKCYLCSDMNINSIDDALTIDETEMNKWNI